MSQELSENLIENFREKKPVNPNLNSAHFNGYSCCNEENLQLYVCSGRTQMSLINFQKTNSDQLEIFG